MINAQYINLNLIPSGVMPVLYCSQYDVGRPLGMVVYNGAESVDLSEYTCTIEATRMDGTAITAAVTTDDNIGVFETTATMTNQADTYKAKFVIVDGNGKRVASLAFVLCVTAATMDENSEEIEEDASLYQQYTGTVQTIIAEIRADLAAEITRATAAEQTLTATTQTLTANLASEASARQTADNALQSAISSEASTRAAQDAILSARMDTFASLPDGSTAGDAELLDIRVGADGVTYPSAGDAVRANDSQLKSQLYFAVSNTSEVVKTIGYKLAVKAIFSQNENYRLESDGRGTSYNGCKIVRYKVTAGDTHYIKIASSPNIPTTFVFKSSDSAVNTNNVGECYHGAYDGFVTVPTGASYLFICKLSSDNVSNVYNVTRKDINQLMNGVVFIYLSGGKTCVRCTSTARAVIEGQYVNLSAMSTDLERSAGTDTVLLTASGFSVKQITAVQEGDLVVAWVYQNTVYSLCDECVWANVPPIGHLVQRSSIPIFINNKKLRHYDVGATSLSKVTNYGSFIKLLNAYGSGMPIAYIDRQNGKQYGIPGSITQNLSDISGKKVLCIGDSITNRGWYQQRIKSYVGSAEFIGTRNTQYNNLLCEGYSGCKAKTVLSESTITPYGESAIANPFWDSANNQISFSYYCTNLGVSPDMVVIEFGLNETSASDYRTAVQNFIDEIKSYNSAIKVYVVQPFPEADMGANNRTVYSQNFALKQCILEAESFTNCTIIPCWYIMVDELDYQTAMLDCGYGNVQVQGLADAVHPAENTGFAKLGDMIYNYLGA